MKTQSTNDLNPTRYFTPEELAARFKVSIMTITRLARQRRLHGIRCGKQWRFSEDAVRIFERGGVGHGHQATRS